ncbi:hypothetical protein DQ04_07991060, partial [Trypanosoma grayi]|uniref:hypothetical protein n=1 Tax=Trypanosoma grayi TaxID=71804 RepID=UPI0004F4B246
MSDGGTPAGGGADLSLQTIMEQQRIIDALREIIAALKTRVATLEAAAKAQPPGITNSGAASAAVSANTVTITEHAEVVERLNATVAQLTSERDAAAAECTALRAAAVEG